MSNKAVTFYKKQLYFATFMVFNSDKDISGQVFNDLAPYYGDVRDQAFIFILNRVCQSEI